MAMFHVFVLIMSLAGGPPRVAESMAAYDTKEACSEHEDEFVDKVKEFLDKNGITAYQVAASRCATEAEMSGDKHEDSI